MVDQIWTVNSAVLQLKSFVMKNWRTYVSSVMLCVDLETADHPSLLIDSARCRQSMFRHAVVLNIVLSMNKCSVSVWQSTAIDGWAKPGCGLEAIDSSRL